MDENNKQITTIKLTKETKDRIDKLKIHPRESYDEVLKKLLGILNICKIEPEKARAKLREIDKAKSLNKM